MLNISNMNPLTRHALLAIIVEYYGNKYMNHHITVHDNLLDIANYMADNYSEFTTRHRPNYKMLASENPTLYRMVTKAIAAPDSVSLEVYDLVQGFIDFTDSLIYDDAVMLCHKLLAMLESDRTRADIMDAWFERALPHCDYNASGDTIDELLTYTNFYRGDK